MADLRKSIAAAEPELHFSFANATWVLRRIPAGKFVMGTPLDELGREDGEMTPREVTISKPFYIAKYETTQKQYAAVMGTNPSKFSGEDLPVDQIRYADALEYCRKLSDITGVKVTLPSEAQWEYAARAGTALPYYSGPKESDLQRIAWYRANSGNTPHAVGAKEPNAWGLYDMLGNVYEPCIDYILSFDKLTSVDPVGVHFLTHGAARGGAWMQSAQRLRVGSRIQTDDMFGGLGIRIVIIP